MYIYSEDSGSVILHLIQCNTNNDNNNNNGSCNNNHKSPQKVPLVTTDRRTVLFLVYVLFMSTFTDFRIY